MKIWEIKEGRGDIKERSNVKSGESKGDREKEGGEREGTERQRDGRGFGLCEVADESNKRREKEEGRKRIGRPLMWKRKNETKERETQRKKKREEHRLRKIGKRER